MTGKFHILMPYTIKTLDGRHYGGGCVDEVFTLGQGDNRQLVYRTMIAKVREQNPDKIIMPISFSVEPNNLF